MTRIGITALGFLLGIAFALIYNIEGWEGWTFSLILGFLVAWAGYAIILGALRLFGPGSDSP